MRNASLAGYTNRVAESRTVDLLLGLTKAVWIEFWLHQIRFLLLCGLSVIVLLMLFPYTYDLKQGFWLLLTVFAHGIALWGALRTAQGLARLEIELAIVKVVETNGEKYLRDISDHDSAKVDLDRLEQNILPHNSSQPSPAMIRLFRHVVKEAKNRKFDSSINLTQPYKEEVLDDIFRLQNYQKIALWLGILGTFGGILLALQAGELHNLSSKSVEDFSKIIAAMFDKLVISFSASLAGLESAILLGFFLLMLRKRQEAYFKSIEGAVVTMLSLAHRSINKDDFLSDLNQAAYELRKVRETLSSQITTVNGSIVTLQQQIIHQTKQIQNGIDKLPETNSKFDTFIKKAEDQQNQMADEMRNIYNSIALKTALQESIQSAGKQISDSVAPQVLKISTQLEVFNQTVSNLNTVFGQQVKTLSDTVQRVEGRIKEHSTRTSEFTKTFDGRMRELSGKVNQLHTASYYSARTGRGTLWQRIKEKTQDFLR